ncbi:MAG: transglycosylase SLT domain-containing protein [Desulfuromonadaceae bacterium]|nr:transglycosylase SLT domain-containing protein [Desulfuromonadaceae bacterium]
MSYRFRKLKSIQVVRAMPVLLAFVGATFLAGSTRPLQADDYLVTSALQYRDKDFAGAYTSAGKSSDLTHRSFVRGMAALRMEKFEEAVALLADAEQKLPLIADYAAYFQAKALLKLKKYPEAAAKAASIKPSFASPRMVRLSEKLYADILYESGDYKGALTSYQTFMAKYPSGGDVADAGFSSARCREESADINGAAQIYRSIWLNNPASPLAARSQERLERLELSGIKLPQYSQEELLARAATLYAQRQYSASIKTLEMIPAASRPQAVANRINLRTGMALYRLRRYKQAETEFMTAAVSTLPEVRSTARFWLAKSLENQGDKERSLVMYLELAGEGKKEKFADDALIEAAGLKRGLGKYAEAACLYDQAARLSSDAKAAPQLIWDSGWCRYLAGEYPAAANNFKELLADETEREKALYWLGRALEKERDPAASAYYHTLLDEFPAGFYATWHREQNGIKDLRESFGNREALAELPLPAGFDKARLLASLGMLGDARSEMASTRKKNGDRKGQFPGLARVYLEMRDYGSAIYLFMQNRPVAWEKAALPLWAAGYPRAYTELVRRNAELNGLSEGLVYALIRAESGFAPAIKSGAGAIGLMQMMPATAKQTAREKGEFDPLRLISPEYNIRLGTKHLSDLMEAQDGDVIYMAAAYNAGSGALGRWKKSLKGLDKDEFIESIPYKETRNYVKKVYASAATYRQLYGLK